MTFHESSIADITLFVSVTMIRDVMPSVTIPRAIERTRKVFGHLCEDCSPEALEQRFIRMQSRFRHTLRTELK